MASATASPGPTARGCGRRSRRTRRCVTRSCGCTRSRGGGGIFVNPLFTTHIVGVPERESRAVLELLYAHAVSPEYTVRFAWQPGSVAFWDNRATQHKPVNDHGSQHRMMHRVTIEGDRPLGPGAQ